MSLVHIKRSAVIYTVSSIHSLCSIDASFFPKFMRYAVTYLQSIIRKKYMRRYEQFSYTLLREKNLSTSPIIVINETNTPLIDILSKKMNISILSDIVPIRTRYGIADRSFSILNILYSIRIINIEKYISIWWQNSLYHINQHRMIRYALVKLHTDCLVNNLPFTERLYSSLKIANRDIRGDTIKQGSHLGTFRTRVRSLMPGAIIWSLNILLRREVFPKARKALQSILQYSYPLEKQSLKPGPPTAYLLVPDGPSGTNTKAALPVAKALRDGGTPCLVLSNSHVTVETMTKAGIEAVQLPTMFTGFAGLVADIKATGLVNTWIRDRRGLLGSAFDQNFYYLDLNMPRYITIADAIQKACRKIFARRRPTVFLTLTETHPYCVAAAMEARDHGARWIGWLHMLIMDIPDYRHFPADYHLFYGDHGKDIYSRCAVTPGPALSIGSPLYDQAFGRAKDADTAVVRRMLPDWDGRPLIVVGTENRANQLVEITATLTALRSLNNIHTVVKLHPDDDLKTFLELVTRLKLPPQRFAVVKDCDLDALLNAADVLITTFSNIIINAAVLGTAVISHNYTNAFGVDFAAAAVGCKATSPEELLVLLSRLLGEPAFRTENVEASRLAVRQFISEHGGRSATAIAQVMAALHSGDDDVFASGSRT